MFRFLLFLFVFLKLLLAFQVPNITFNPEKALDFWYYESASYCSKEKLSIWNTSLVSAAYPNITDISVIFDQEGQNQAYSAYDPDRNLIFLAFRGTSNLVNWEEDLDITQSKANYCPDCFIHTGFIFAYNGLKNDAESSILKLKQKYPKAEAAIIGHSLGAAFAALAFIDLYESLKPQYFYTFGMPRMGNDKFAEFMDSHFLETPKIRITHNRDIVPRMPGISFGYQHFETEVFYSEDCKTYKICDGIYDESCISQYYLVDFSIEDHRTMFGLNVHEYKYTCQ